MPALDLQLSMRQMMIGVGSIGLILALVVRAMRGDYLTTVVLEITWLSCPLWGSIGLALLTPMVTRGLFLGSCLVGGPVSGFFFFRSTQESTPNSAVWLLLGLCIL